MTANELAREIVQVCKQNEVQPRDAIVGLSQILGCTMAQLVSEGIDQTELTEATASCIACRFNYFFEDIQGSKT